MVKRITGEQTPRRRRHRPGGSKPYSYASREGMTGGSVTASPGRLEARNPTGAPRKPGTVKLLRRKRAPLTVGLQLPPEPVPAGNGTSRPRPEIPPALVLVAYAESSASGKAWRS